MGGCPLIRVCSLIRSNTVLIICSGFLFNLLVVFIMNYIVLKINTVAGQNQTFCLYASLILA